MRVLPGTSIVPLNLAQVKPYLRAEVSSHQIMNVLSNRLQRFHSLTTDEVNTLHTTVLKMTDPRCNTPEMQAAKKAEIEGLLRRGTFRVISVEAIPPGANVLLGRFVLAIKSDPNATPK